jgi:hypothetical protein
MASARPLRDVFTELVGAPSAADDPAALLSDHGHPGLPDDLVAEAVVSYADTAPLEVAEHLAPYVTAHSTVGAGPVTGDEPGGGWLDLLGTAPDVAGDEPADLDGLAPAHDGFAATDPEPDAGLELDAGLEFGTGAGAASGMEPGESVEAAEDGLVEILADPAEPAGRGDEADWASVTEETDLTADESGDDEGKPDGEPLG